MRRQLGMLAAVIALAAGLWGQSKERIRALQEKLVAPCCWNESVASHRSEIAAEMRAEISRMVSEGRSDREILDYYKAKYGARILMEPEGELRLWAYTIPVIASLAGLAFVIWVIRRMLRQQPAAPASPAA